MGIVARHIGGLETSHVLVAQNDVLDDLVQRGAHVDVAIGIRRAIVQDPAGFALVVFDHLLVDVVLLPVFQHFRLFFRQTISNGVCILWMVSL